MSVNPVLRTDGLRQRVPSRHALCGARIALLFAGMTLGACTHDCTPQLRDGWIRVPPGTTTTMAGFGRIENACPTPATIVAVRSPAFADASLHETRLLGGISRMRAVPELRIPPDDVAVLKPGGLHLMLMRPNAPLQHGSRVAVQFELADGRQLLGEFEMRAIQEQ